MSLSLALSAALVQFAALSGPVPSLGDAPALRFADLHLTTGVRLRYAEQGDPHGHPVILLHGYSDSWFSYSRVLPLMDPKDHVYALDLRGHGDSDRPASGYAMRDLAADVLAFMNAQRLARVTVVGHSMGSIVAQQLALAAPERIARLVLIGATAAPAESPVLTELDSAVRSLGDSIPVEFVREFQNSTVYQPIPAEFMDRAVAESLKLPAGVWRELIAGMLAADPAVGLGRSRIPTLILWGDRDGVFSRAEQGALVKLMPAAEFTVYPEAGHAPHWERPQEFVRDLYAFMDRTTSY